MQNIYISSGKALCRFCGEQISTNSLSAHIGRVHPRPGPTDMSPTLRKRPSAPKRCRLQLRSTNITTGISAHRKINKTINAYGRRTMSVAHLLKWFPNVKLQLLSILILSVTSSLVADCSGPTPESSTSLSTPTIDPNLQSNGGGERPCWA